MRRKLFLTVLFLFSCLFCLQLFAQNPGRQELYKVTQVPPDAAALGKYGEYPVGYYTGTPSINIPFYELTAGRIKVPIGISYHAGGIKVEEIASSVGLGWALNAGGVITRTVMGMPDEVENEEGSFLNPTMTVRQFWNSGELGDTTFFKRGKKILARRIDGEPDIFYFNFGNVSGKFMYHQQDQKFYSIPYSKLKIEFYNQASNSSFTITDENGIEYLFEEKEYNVRETEETTNPVVTVTTSWYLKTIYDPVSKQTVYLSYTDHITSYSTLSTETHYMPVVPDRSDYSPSSKQNSSMHLKRLSMISTESATVMFDYGLPRCDLPGSDALTGISVVNNDGQNIRDFAFNYDYFIASGFFGTTCTSVEESVYKRLKLTGIDENPGSLSGQLSHRFTYNNVSLPSRFSKAQDHWGFYNGVISNPHLYPPYNLVVSGIPVYLPGGNRDVEPQYAKAAVLEKITYPTGGYTVFDFESNTAVSSQTPLPAVAQNSAFSLFSGGGNYLEKDFVVYSSVCSQNLNQPGVYVTMNITGLNYGLITAFGFPGISILVKAINLDTEDEIDFFQIGGDKSSSTIMPKTFYLPNGNYRFVVDFTDNPFSETYEETRVSLSWINCIPETDMGGMNRYVGGLRVNKITNLSAEGETPVIKSYKYMQPGSPTLTSGQTHFYPKYFSFPLFSQDVQEEGRFSTFLKRSSSSNYPLVSEHGKSVGYSSVQEYNGLDDAKGYTQYSFTNYSDYDDEIGELYSNIPISKQWLRGLELGRKTYAKKNSLMELVSETINEYDTTLLGVNKKVFEGIRGEFIHSQTAVPIELVGEDMVFLGSVHAGIVVHPTYSDFVYLKKTKERTYSGSTYVETVKEFEYNTRNLQPSTVTSIGSDSVKTILQTRYPLDYTVNAPVNTKAQGIKNLQDLNFISPVIEQFAERQKESLPKKLIGANYYSYLADQPLVDTVFTMNIPLSGISDYTGVGISNSSFTRTTGYDPEVIVSQYSSFRNNILQQKKHNGPSTAYIWDHEDLYLIAQVANATLDDIAYTSFESVSTGNWNYSGLPAADLQAVTGYKKYNLTGGTALTKSGLNSTKVYVLSYWTKGTGGENISGHTATVIKSYNGWTNYSVEITGVSTITLSGTVQLDEVRLFPKDSQMTSYTYDLLVGVTSQTDAKGMTTYYEYDDFQRLLNIKDHNGDIVKNYKYNYKQEAGTGLHYNTAITQSFQKNNCPIGQTGSTENYAVAANTYSASTPEEAQALAVADMSANGQKYANDNGTCSGGLYSVTLSRAYQKNNCPPGQTGSMETYNVIKYAITLQAAQADAEADTAANGQTYANANGTCNILSYFNLDTARVFQKSNCAPGQTGSNVTYAVYAGKHSAATQVAADSLAIKDLNDNGQTYADNNGTCSGGGITYYSNRDTTITFQRNNCPSGQTGSSVIYTLPANTFTYPSQFSVDSAVAVNLPLLGQAYANDNGTCLYGNTVASLAYQKSNCPSGQTGSSVTYTVPAGTYLASTLLEANTLAGNDIIANGQAYADANGTCNGGTYYNIYLNLPFQKDNCDPGYVGSVVMYPAAAGMFSASTQAAANALASDYIYANGQANANANGTCIYTGVYYNTVLNQSFQRNNCPSGQTGQTVTYTVPARTYSSEISQSDAEAQAAADAATYGQAYANAVGGCGGGGLYAKIIINNESIQDYMHLTPASYERHGDVYVQLYSDSACTMPYTTMTTMFVHVKYFVDMTGTLYPGGLTHSEDMYVEISPNSSSAFMGNAALDYKYYDVSDFLEATVSFQVQPAPTGLPPYTPVN